jgi:hypothetical protein
MHVLPEVWRTFTQTLPNNGAFSNANHARVRSVRAIFGMPVA